MTKAPLGGRNTGANPTDRAKSGSKRSLLTDGAGVPLALAVSGANTHDMRLAAPTLNSLAVERPEPMLRKKQHFCADKGYDYQDAREPVAEWGYTTHIKSRGEEEVERGSIPGYRTRRWVVARTHSWFNRLSSLWWTHSPGSPASCPTAETARKPTSGRRHCWPWRCSCHGRTFYRKRFFERHFAHYRPLATTRWTCAWPAPSHLLSAARRLTISCMMLAAFPGHGTILEAASSLGRRGDGCRGGWSETSSGLPIMHPH